MSDKEIGSATSNAAAEMPGDELPNLERVNEGSRLSFKTEDDNHEETNDEQGSRTFPQKLMQVLADESHSDIISWCPDGNAFMIHKKRVFAAEILPKYFKATKYTSFTRKLNRWGFNRTSRGPSTGSYVHKLFRRDRPDLVLSMTSNSGGKNYQTTPTMHHLLPNSPMMPYPPMFPYMVPPPPMGNVSDQQAMWQQQMHHMHMMHMNMMHMNMHHMNMSMQHQQRMHSPQAKQSTSVTNSPVTTGPENLKKNEAKEEDEDNNGGEQSGHDSPSSVQHNDDPVTWEGES